MNNDLNTMSRKELLSLRTNVEKALSTVAAREKKAAIEAAERAAAEHGFTLAELQGGGGKSARIKPKSPAKYRNPANGTDTWSGRGRKPHWVLDLQKSGKNLEDYTI
jgi:DNA-binding protein H-NS